MSSTATFRKPKIGASLWMDGFGTIYFHGYLKTTNEVVYTDSKTDKHFQRVDASKVQHRKPNAPKHYAKYL